MIPVPRSLHPHLRWWLEESNVLPGQPLHPLKHVLQILTDASKEVWGAHLNDHTARGTWSLPESKLHINYLELKAVFLALKEFKDLCENNIDLIATDNTTVVAYINRRGDEVGPSGCPSVENPDLVFQKTGYSKSPTHSRPAECGSRQAILARPDHSNRVVSPPRGLPNNMQMVAPTPDRPICYDKSLFNNKMAQFVSPVPDPLAWAVDALSLPWEDLDPYAFPLVAILGKVVEKLQDHPCKKIILIAPGWPNMPWFWDLVTMSSQIPLCMPKLSNLVTQPFYQTPHRKLSNLNLHAWLLEPQQSSSRASLTQWQHELRLLKQG